MRTMAAKQKSTTFELVVTGGRSSYLERIAAMSRSTHARNAMVRATYCHCRDVLGRTRRR